MPHFLRYLEDLEHPNPATIARAAASLTFAWLENSLANRSNLPRYSVGLPAKSVSDSFLWVLHRSQS